MQAYAKPSITLKAQSKLANFFFYMPTILKGEASQAFMQIG